MICREQIHDDYFEWMYHIVCDKRYTKPMSFGKLLYFLNSIEFTYTIPKDRNRAEDGIALRYRYANATDCEGALDYLIGPCSVLEMMIALAIKCEENIMDDPDIGDRTGQWFWEMITNLGLGAMTDTRYDQRLVEDVIVRFLHRDYEPNGRGGLFTVRNCDRDLRDVEIWAQLCWYLDDI